MDLGDWAAQVAKNNAASRLRSAAWSRRMAAALVDEETDLLDELIDELTEPRAADSDATEASRSSGAAGSVDQPGGVPMAEELASETSG